VLDRDPVPPIKKGHSPQFSADVYCGRKDGCSKMPLSTEVGLGPGDIVLDGAQLAPKAHDPNFRRIPVAKRSPVSATAELL